MNLLPICVMSMRPSLPTVVPGETEILSDHGMGRACASSKRSHEQFSPQRLEATFGAGPTVRPSRALEPVRSWRALGGLVLLLCLSACGKSKSPETGELSGVRRESRAAPSSADDQAPFVECAEQVGLVFKHFNGMRGQFYFPEIMGSGVAVLDYDNDGDLDVFAVQGNYLSSDVSGGTGPAAASESLATSDRLFRNDLKRQSDGTMELHFTDVTREAGISSAGFGMGVAVGDINNDGFPDLYVTKFGPNTWWLNRRDGTFVNYGERSGVPDPGLWSSSAAFLDFDRDGWLDLFVCEYVRYTLANHVECKNSRSAIDYCGPEVYAPESHRLLRNRGDGTFEDVSAPSRIASKAGTGLGVIAADFNGDHWTDIFVANDGMANFLWINRKDGTCAEEALLSGCAFNLFGREEAGMGVDAADFDADGDEDLFITHLVGEKNTLYLNESPGLFGDQSEKAGLDRPSRPYTAFGTGWFDYDLDGDLDLYAVNGAVKAVDALVDKGDPYPYAMADQLFENRGGQYVEVNGGLGFQKLAISRGSVDADLDNDGDPDLLVNDVNGPLRLLLNRTNDAQGWIGFRIVHKRTGWDWLGARVALVKDGTPVAWRRVRTDGSYCSARDPRIVFGLRKLEFDAVWIVLPDGTRHSLGRDLRRGAYNTVALP